MSAPISGNGGTVSVAAVTTYDIRSWSLSRSADNQAYVSSQTSGKTYRIKGNRDMTMHISLYAPDGDIDLAVGIEEGETIAVVATTDGSTSWSGNVIIDNMELVVNVETGENIGIELDCSGVDTDSYPA